ncbi:Multimodular transpeptidase-transglycosylase [Hyphomicrobium sulfonivorans]|uniref:peptidoglycan glycosyltransferase n=1 Tax=Hyphomicrobium sulfonivorans TaxID=121290 RepID=A0A109BER1_HYPSL|nr:penicillin-binding protein 1C [Hyphomicrobium sulfonivorans]KWT67396.1 Multimodular transpeptidase-transglycosylase [Hyphomicrobium sulfonivorans]
MNDAASNASHEQRGIGAFLRRCRHAVTRRKLAMVSAVFGAFSLCATAAIVFTVSRMPPPDLAAAEKLSTVVLDRNGQLLRAFTTSDGRWRLPVEVADVDQRYLAMLMAFEDKRFYSHGGVDVRSVARASWQLITHGRIVSGASTLTMQVVRLLEGRYERSGNAKLRQVVGALRLEHKLTKTEVLALYLRLAPFGGNIEGVRAASLAYFGKEPQRLSIGQAALLVALPQSPEWRRPDRNPKAARIARNRVLQRAVEEGVINQAEADRAILEPVPTHRRAFPQLAPHIAESEVRADPIAAEHRLTIDRNIQRALETLAREQTALLGQKLSAAILAIDHTSGEIVAHVGSAGYLDGTRAGAIDMVTAVRSPGSTLKPFIYGLAFEAGLAHPETLIEDRPVRFGSYAPKNFDEDFHGTVTIRHALSQSLNIPAVKVLAAVGPGKLAGRFRKVGAETVFPDATQPTLAMALGGVGLTLRDVATLYTGLARGGDVIQLTHRRADAEAAAKALLHGKQRKHETLLSPVATWYVSDILKDAPPPLNARAGRFAYKTGTSYGYRDAWAVGYDGKYTIAVWVGRPDAASTPGLTGRLAAAPILFDAFARIGEKRVPLAGAPAGALRVSGSELPPPLKRFREGGAETVQGPFLEPRVVISYPPDRSEVETESEDALLLKASGGVLPLTWLVNGAPIESDPRTREVIWQPDGDGFVRLSVVDAKGRVDRVTVRLKSPEMAAVFLPDHGE